MSKINLAKIPLLKKLTAAELKLLSGFLLEKQYQADEYIFHTGLPQDRLIIVESGQAALLSEIEGQHQPIALFKAGDFAGEISLFAEQQKHNNNLRALTPVTTLELHSRHWPSIIKTAPALKEKIYQQVSLSLHDRLLHADNKLFSLFALSQFISQNHELSAIAKKFIAITLKSIPCQSAALLTYWPANNKLHVHYALAYPTLKVDHDYNINTWPLFQDLIRHPRTLIFQASDLPRAQTLFPDLVKNTNIISPIILSKKILGFILLGNKHDDQTFNANNQILLEAMAMQIAGAIQQAHFSDYEKAESEANYAFIDPLA